MPPLEKLTRHTFPILLVEDDRAIIDLLQRTAKSSFPEADFIPITTFEEAVVYLYNIQGRGPKLILLDIYLPGNRTGLDFLKLLKTHKLGKFLPAIVFSHSDNKEHCKEAYQLGATSYFVKPFTWVDCKNFLQNIREFWYETATLPRTYFENQQEQRS